MARLSRTELTVYDENRADESDGALSSSQEGLVDPTGAKEDYEEHFLAAQWSQSNLDRRISAITDTTISSMPDSLYPTDNDFAVSTSKQLTPQSARQPYEKRPELRRAQLSSPIPFERYNQRWPTQRALKARTGLPTKPSKVRNSPLQRRAQRQQEDDAREYPLVLLHITLLPIAMPWSLERMREVLPERILENLQTLKSKANDTILRRGILIPHPREEYDLLEERLLEALDLRQERLTADGHFRRLRDSEISEATTVSGHSRHDSGLGSSEEDGSDDGDETCTICQTNAHALKDSIASGGQKWDVRVYAANGLMKAAAWSACWPEMERVDVEITPLIPDDMRRRLDAKLHEERVERAYDDNEEERIRLLVEEQVRLAQEEREQAMRIEDLARDEAMARRSAGLPPVVAAPSESRRKDDPALQHTSVVDDLPQIYRRSQIPLTVLFRNYVYVVAQDRRNAVIFFLGVIAIYFGFQAYHSPLQHHAPLEMDIAPDFHTIHTTDVAPLLVQSIQAMEMSESVIEIEVPSLVTTEPDSTQTGEISVSILEEEGETRHGLNVSDDIERDGKSSICPWVQMQVPDDLFDEPICLGNRQCPVGGSFVDQGTS